MVKNVITLSWEQIAAYRQYDIDKGDFEMKKVLPFISLLCYVVAVAGCIAHIICTVIPSVPMAVLFVAFVAVTVILMALSTAVAIKSKPIADTSENGEVFDGLTVDEESETNDVTAAQTEHETDSVSAVFAYNAEEEAQPTETVTEESAEISAPETQPALEAPAEETTAELEENTVEAEESTEDAVDDAPDLVILPLAEAELDDDEPDEPDEDDEEDEDDDESDAAVIVADAEETDELSARFKRSRYKFSYTSKLIQADNETKGYYSIVKNAFMSYKKVTTSVSREHERIRRGRTTIGIIKLRGKTVLLYLALDPAQFENTMYVGTNVSDIVKYADVPFLYRVKGPRKANRAVRLIGMIAEKFGLEATAEPANEDYVALYPYETTEALIEKGLVIDKVAEAARKAEEARVAAEEAAKAAEKAIEDAIKAQETAEQAAVKAAERAEEPHEEVEFKPADTDDSTEADNANT